MALLAQSTSGVREAQVLDRVKRFDRYLEHIGVEQAGGINSSVPAVRHALQRFHDEKLIQQLGEAGGPFTEWR